MPSRRTLMLMLLVGLTTVVVMGPDRRATPTATLPRYAGPVSFEVPTLAMVSDDDLGLSLTDQQVARILTVYDDYLFLSDVALINSSEDATLDFSLADITSRDLLADIDRRRQLNQSRVDAGEPRAVVDLMSWSDVYNVLGSPSDTRLYDCTELTTEYLDGTGSTSFVDREIVFRLIDGRWMVVGEHVLDDGGDLSCVPGPNRTRARAAVRRLLATVEQFELNPLLEPSAALAKLAGDEVLAELEADRLTLVDDGVAKLPVDRQERLMVVGARGTGHGAEVVVRACIDHPEGVTFATMGGDGRPVGHELDRPEGHTTIEEFVVGVSASETVVLDRRPTETPC